MASEVGYRVTARKLAAFMVERNAVPPTLFRFKKAPSRGAEGILRICIATDFCASDADSHLHVVLLPFDPGNPLDMPTDVFCNGNHLLFGHVLQQDPKLFPTKAAN